MNTEIVSTQKARVVGYFPAAAPQTQNYRVTNIPADRFTHVIYASADVNSDATCASVNAGDDKVNLEPSNL